MAVMVPVEVKVADAEPVRSLLNAVAEAVAGFAKLGDEERAALPESVRGGVDILIDAAQDFMTHN